MQKKKQYTQKLIDTFKFLLTQPGILLDIQKLRIEWKIPLTPDRKIKEIKHNPYATKNGTVDEDVDIYELISTAQDGYEKRKKRKLKRIEQMNTIMEKYNIPYVYFDVLNIFIYTGDIHSYLITDTEDHGAYFFSLDTMDGPIMAIRIFDNTTSADIKNAWKEIEHYRSKFLKKPSEKHNRFSTLDRDLRILQLKNTTKMKAIDIYNQIKKDGFSLPRSFQYPAINITIQRYRNKHKRNKSVLPLRNS